MTRTNYFRLLLMPLILICICLNSAAYAQSSKPHFEIKNAKDQKETVMYQNALKDVDFESFRFLSQRRTIHFVNSPVTVELFSAQELLDLYGRPIHESNILNNKAIKDIQFEYFPQSGAAKAIINN